MLETQEMRRPPLLGVYPVIEKTCKLKSFFFGRERS